MFLPVVRVCQNHQPASISVMPITQTQALAVTPHATRRGNSNARNPQRQSQVLRVVTDEGVLDEPLQLGIAGNLQTLRKAAALVRAAVADIELRDWWFKSHLKQIRGHDFTAELQAAFEFAQKRIVYRRDPIGFEKIQSARQTIIYGYGDCVDKSILLAALLSISGQRCRFVVISYKPPAFQHVYVEAFIKNAWIALDPTNENELVGWEERNNVLKRATYGIFGPEADQLSGFKSFFKKVGKGIAKVAKVTVPMALNIIPGVGQVASAGAAAAFGAIDAKKAKKKNAKAQAAADAEAARLHAEAQKAADEKARIEAEEKSKKEQLEAQRHQEMLAILAGKNSKQSSNSSGANPLAALTENPMIMYGALGIGALLLLTRR